MGDQVIPVERITRSILVIRRQKVLLDADLAELYGVETKVLNQAVRRNSARFPADFMFQLVSEEVECFEVTICDLKLQRRASLVAVCLHRAGRRYVVERVAEPAGNRR